MRHFIHSQDKVAMTKDYAVQYIPIGYKAKSSE